MEGGEAYGKGDERDERGEGRTKDKLRKEDRKAQT